VFGHFVEPDRNARGRDVGARMKIVMFGLTISSSWGNGHATLLRGLFKALVARGHRIVFFERDVPYYARHRDMVDFPGVELHLYADWSSVRRGGYKRTS
jgi:spore maturation protein CgeB